MNRLILCCATAIFLTGQVSAQLITNVASFTGANGAQPISRLIQATDGNFYGTTTNGGTTGYGTVFKMTAGGTLSALVSFNSNNGAIPMSGVIQGTNGDLFGTTRDGGANNLGTVFKVTLGGALTTLYSFAGPDGAHPYGGLVQGTDGNFYGTTFDGSPNNLGTIFQITAAGALTTLAQFAQTNGGNPTASLIQGSDGNFYGTTPMGGNFVTNGITYLYGTIFKLSAGTIATLNSFGPDNGALPYGTVAQGNDGNFYGTTVGPGNGTAFKMLPDGTLTSTALNTDGDQPLGALIQATDGNFYGTTRQTVFQMTPSGTVTTVATVGGTCYAGLMTANDGNFYGTTAFGGTQSTGSVFRLVPRPQFTAPPTNQTVYSNATVVLTATATGIAPLNFQWKKNGVNIGGATTSVYTISGAQTSDSATYTLAVTNGFGTSNVAAIVTVLPPTVARFQNFTRTGGNVGLSWTSDIGTPYNLQYKTNLTDALWSTVSTTTATSNTLALNIAPGTDVQGFYRISSYYNSSDPIGFVQLPLLGNSDSYISVPFLRPPAASANVSSIASNVISVTQQYPGTWTLNQFVYAAGMQSNNYYLRFTTGALEGRTFAIISNATSSVTVNLNSNSLASVVTGDAFVIEPYWSLNSVFPSGAGVNVSPTVGNRNTEILIPDMTNSGINLSSSKIYYFNAGLWKQTGQGNADHGDDTLPLNAPFIVRHNVSTNTTLLCVGAVPIGRWNIPLRVPDGSAGNKQDSFFGLARPVTVTLDDSGLISSGAFAPSPLPGSRTDELLTFDNTSVAKNKSSSAVYYYWNSAWRRVGAGTTIVGGTPVFVPGSGVIIRKGTNIAAPIWTNAPNY